MTAVDRKVEVGGLGLCRKAGRWPASLNINDDHWKFNRDRKRDGFALQCDAGA